MKPKPIIILLGVPGSGKGTLAKQITGDYPFKHISTGAIMREITKKDDLTKEEQHIHDAMEHGRLVEDEYIIPLVTAEIKKGLKEKRGIVLDGVVRTEVQARTFQEFFEKEKLNKNVVVIELAIPDEITEARLLKRAKESGGERSDDTPDVIKERIKKQGNAILKPITDYYESVGMLIRLDGKQNIDYVYNAFKEVLNDVL